ncbi:hypothetical protein H7X46_08915 [Pseudonocardia sp. C8]|uniref:hypothetical protein n=1 Tax=Pseudonocardia sp. C8 TaxID=2762759 RepID=UPI00164364D1|nr:hypothetical protein [Pseudonocardia sp. C8]MBC3191180.1 hypothetical protein [Pseudonocardia sp. C8]
MTIETGPGVRVWWCGRGHACFPRRLVCPVCRDTGSSPRAAREGVVEEVTDAPGTGVRMVTVRLPEGPRLLGRVEAEAGPGDRLPLSAVPGVPGAVHVPDPHDRTTGTVGP